MKYVILTGMILFACVAITFAQTTPADTNDIHLKAPLKPDPPPGSSTRPKIPEVNPYDNTSPLIRIRIDEVPARLKRNLQNEKYSGWESAPIFKDADNNLFSIDIRSGDSLKTFRFNEDGELIDVTPRVNE